MASSLLTAHLVIHHWTMNLKTEFPPGHKTPLKCILTHDCSITPSVNFEGDHRNQQSVKPKSFLSFGLCFDCTCINWCVFTYYFYSICFCWTATWFPMNGIFVAFSTHWANGRTRSIVIRRVLDFSCFLFLHFWFVFHPLKLLLCMLLRVFVFVFLFFTVGCGFGEFSMLSKYVVQCRPLLADCSFSSSAWLSAWMAMSNVR